MKKTYIYHRFIRWGQYDVLIFFSLATLFLCGFTLSFSQPLSAILNLPFWTQAIADLILFLSLGLVGYYFLHKSAAVKITLDDQHLLYHKPHHTINLPYQDIENVKSRLAFGGGWFSICSQNHKFHIGITLENISDFILVLKDRLDHHDLSDRYQSKNLFKALKNAVYSEHLYSRIKYHFLVSALIITINIILSHYFANFSDHFPSNTHFVFITSLCWLLIPYTTSEIIIYRHTSRQADLASFTCPPPTPQVQKNVLLCSYLAAELIYFTPLNLILFLKP